MISTNTTGNDDNCGRQFRSVMCFRDHGSPHAFICELFPMTSINLDILYWQQSIRKYLYSTHETLDFALGLFISSWFILRLTFTSTPGKSICLCFLCMLSLKSCLTFLFFLK